MKGRTNCCLPEGVVLAGFADGINAALRGTFGKAHPASSTARFERQRHATRSCRTGDKLRIRFGQQKPAAVWNKSSGSDVLALH